MVSGHLRVAMGSCRIRSKVATRRRQMTNYRNVYVYNIFIYNIHYCRVNNILLIFTLQVASYMSFLWEKQNAFQTIGQATRKRGDDVINCQSSPLPTQKNESRTQSATGSLDFSSSLSGCVFFFPGIPGYPHIVGVSVIVEILFFKGHNPSLSKCVGTLAEVFSFCTLLRDVKPSHTLTVGVFI